MIIKVASCDSQGEVYIGEDAVYRVIPSTHAGNVIEILGIIGDGIKGIIETSVCAEGAVPTEINPQPGSVTLRHRKIARISYPHEWCAKMLQDAAFFHLELSEMLLKKDLVLKDAHPWNILFDKGLPVFVDFTSIVTYQDLFSEEYLESNKLYFDAPFAQRLSMLVHEIFTRMFKPYFSNPLLFYAYGERERVRPRIENTTLNASTSTIDPRECIPKFRICRSAIRKMLLLLTAKSAERHISTKLREAFDIKRFFSDMREYVQNLSVSLGESAYSAYYKQKGEDQDFVYSEEWNAKQKSVHSALSSPNILSVLDVACNTGWFALMAEKLGKSVIAFDIDEGCIEALYGEVKHSQLNVLPLVMNFTHLTCDRYSIYDGNKVLISAKERLRSDSVIALGIVHHLVLGLGLSFDEVLDSLVDLCEKQLVIEFIAPDDAMIQQEPSFFQAYFKDKSIIHNYSMQSFIERIEARNFNVTLLDSHPLTRKILVCNRQTK